MQHDNPVAVVEAWQDAANRQDIDGLLAVSDAAIELVGPRGVGRGHQLLRDWLGRAGLQLTTLRVFARGSAVVVEQRGVWRAVDSGEAMGERTLASRFMVDGGRVTQFERYDHLDDALAGASLSYKDEARSG